MMKRLLIYLMLLAFAIPLAIAGEKTITISRNEGIYDDGTGVYYCTKGGVTMTFSSGLNNVNYLVEHQQVVFDIFTTNYVIKKIKFNCLDNTTNEDETFYWGPSTIHELGAVATYVPTGTYTYDGFVGTWVGGPTPSKYVKFVTEARPVRFGSVEITYDKEFGDIYEKVTSNDEIENGQTYALVSQYASKALGKEDYYGTDNLTTFTSTPVTLLDNNNKVKVTDEVQLIKLQSSGNSSRPWYIKVGDNYMRRRSGDPSGSSSGAAYGQGYNLYSVGSVTNYEQYFRVSISVTGNTNQNALIRFDHNTTETAGDKTFAIRHYNGGSLFRDMDYSTANNQYSANQRVYLYKPAQSYEVTTECIPTNGGYITLSGGILTDDQGRNWSQHFDNVTFFVGTANGYGIGEVTLTDLNTRAVTVLQPTATSDFGNDYSFEMPNNDVKITANFVQPYDIHTVINPNDDSGSFEFIDGYTDFNGQPKSNEGKTVTFKPVPADGYSFNSVTITDDVTGETTTMTPDANGVYSFVMPGNSVTLTANFEAAHDLYLLGTANGRTGWVPYGPKFTFDGVNEKYYIDVYFKGGNDDLYTDPAYGYFSLTKRISDPESPNWNDLNGFRLAAENNNTWVEDGYTGVSLYGDRPDNAFKIKPGVYRIEVNAAMTELSIIEYPLTVTFDPVSGTVVEPGDNVSFTSNLNDLVHAINSQEDAASYSSTDNWGVQATGNTHPITHDDITTVTGQSSIGYITATGTADYEIIGDLYMLGTANGETGWHPYGPKFTYDEANEEYYIDVYFKGGNDDPNTDPAYGYFSLTKRISDPASPNWNDLNGFRLAAENNNTWVEDGYTGVALYGDRPDNAFKIKPGVYRIKVNKAKTQMSIIEYPLTLTFNPVSGSTVAAGTTVDISSNLNDLVHGINANEVNATFKYATSTDGTLPTPNTVGSTVTINAEGATTTVNAEASIGYIVVPGNANYTVPAPTIYSITTQVNPTEAGTITTSTSGAAAGATVDFTVTDTDASVYTLVGVEVVDSNNGIVQSFEPNSTGSYSFTMPDDNVTIHADYVRTPYNVTTSWSPSAGGSVWLNGVNTPQTVTVPNADPVVFGVAPAAGYALNSLTVTNTATGQEITPTPTGSSNEYSFTMPAGNVTIVANFSELPKYNIHTTVTPENGGTINVQNIAYVGETVDFTFIESQSPGFDDYYLYSITVTNESTGEIVSITQLSDHDPSYRFVMPDADVTIAAVLKKNHQVNTSWTPQNGGSVGLLDASGNTYTTLTQKMGDTVKFIVTVNPGFVLSSLVVNPGAIETTFNEDGGYYTFVMPDDNVLVKATFEVKGEYQVFLVNNPNEGGSMTATGHVKIENGNVYSDEGMTVVITPTPKNDWLFDGISAQDENGNPVELTSNGDGTYTMVMPAANVTVTANYHEVPEYNINTDYDPEQGSLTLTGTASDRKAYPGETVTFTVIDQEKYRLDEVYVTVDGTNPEVVLPLTADTISPIKIDYSFTMPTGDVTVHARFKRLYTVELFWIPDNPDRGLLPYGADTVYLYEEGHSRYMRKHEQVEPGNKAIIEIRNLWEDADHGNYTIESCYADAFDDYHSWVDVVIEPVGQEGFEDLGGNDYRMSFVMPEHDVDVYIILRAHTTLKFIESSEFIPDGTPVVVSDELIGTWSAQEALWAKDQVESFNKTENGGGYDYVTDELHLQKKPWNQNNSVLIRFDDCISASLDDPDDAQERENFYIAIEEFVDNYIKEGTIVGTFYCSGNYYSEAIYSGTNDPHNHKAAFEIWVEKMPEHVPGYVNSPSLGYPGYIPDPREDPKSEGGYYDDPIEYNYNHYTPSNFCATNIAGRSGLYPDGGSVVGPQAPDSLQNKQIFFMNPKDQEIAQVWAVYAGHVNNVPVMTSPRCLPEMVDTLSGELFTTYKYLVENGSSYNRHDFTGYFIVPDADEESEDYYDNPNGGWRYNRLSENRFHYGKPTGDKELTINNAYLFHVAIEEIGIRSQIPRAPRRAPQAKDVPEGALLLPFNVYPLDLYDPTKNYTAVREIRPQDSVEIVDIRYYNVMGQESKTPFDGINIIVTRYADGSSSAIKVLR